MLMQPEKKKIVVVDDEQTALLVRCLSRFYEVTAFTDGEQALAYLRENSADLLLTDYQMPIMTGLELIKKVKEFSDVPVALMTGTPDDKLKGIAIPILYKPFDVPELLSFIEQIFSAPPPM